MQEERLVVTTYKPGRKLRLAVALAFLAGISTLIGYLLGSQQFGAAMGDKRELASVLKQRDREMNDLQEQLNHLQLDTEVDKGALERARLAMVDLQNQIYARDEELKLYRDLMQDTEQPTGLSVTGVKLTEIGSNTYRYRWVARRKSNKVQTLGVYAELWVIGSLNGETSSLPISQLDDSISEQPFKLEFKYFAINQGVLRIPDGFKAEKLRIALRYSWEKKLQFDAQFDWNS